MQSAPKSALTASTIDCYSTSAIQIQNFIKYMKINNLD